LEQVEKIPFREVITEADQDSISQEAGAPISIEQIAELTDFPEDFIKKELLLDGVTEISMPEFRKIVLAYLEKSIQKVG
tara:strand:+ start:209 stop:445 length:237 start_codon:yes stop_codon:yes gene_type:complete